MAPPVFATDEDVLLRAPGDFTLLCPRDQVLARGTDGTLVASWNLQSAAVDFPSRGVRPGHVVQLLAPGSSGQAPARLYVLDSVSPGSVILRVQGQSSGEGEPPSPSNSATRTDFLIATLAPQIADATASLDARFRLSEVVNPSADVLTEIKAVVVLTVLERRYREIGHCAGEQADALLKRAQSLAVERDERLARLAIRLDAATNPSSPPRGPWGTRLSR